jgi:uncharacterized protein (DUF1697 family)
MKGNVQYCGFLRGINVGGHALIKMGELKKAFEKIGLENVRTLLASGNVVFEARQSDREMLGKKIEAGLNAVFKKDIKVILRTFEELEKIRSLEPFKSIEVTPASRLYVTFLSEKAGSRKIPVPFSTARGGFRILDVTPQEVFSVLDLSQGDGTPKAMNLLEKEFGSNLTTRNWNTVLRVLGQMEADS